MSVITAGHPGIATALDVDFDGRWAAWRARGLAHERGVRRKLAVVAALAAIAAMAVAIAYVLLRP